MTDWLTLLADSEAFAPLDWRLTELLVAHASEPSFELRLVILLLCRATREGHVCLDLAALRDRSLFELLLGEHRLEEVPFASREALSSIALPDAEGWVRCLVASGICGAPGAELPLVLDTGCVYLERFHRHETTLAKRVVERLEVAQPRPDVEVGRALLERWFAFAPDLARVAAAIAMTRRLCILSGGPGTGKTSTVVRLVGALFELHRRLGRDAPRVMLLAPTGKAAARLGESMLQARTRLAAQLPEVSELPTEAMTVHRALTLRSRGSLSRPMPWVADLVVLDEASMVDLALMRRFFDAAERAARVVILGDPHQLSSVESGAVLGELCAMVDPNGRSRSIADAIEAYAGTTERSRVTDSVDVGDVVVRLLVSHRFKSDGGIGRVAERIREGDVAGTWAALESGDPAIEFVDASAISVDAILERIWAGYKSLRLARDPAEALGAMDGFRVLAVHRRGRFGVDVLNERLEARAMRIDATRSRTTLPRPILVTENAEDGRLYNGDLGVLFETPGTSGAKAYFPSPNGPPGAFGLSRLPRSERAYVMSVHKSQGSEVDEVLVVLPEPTSPLLTRELLYTAITRAKRRCVIVGLRASVERAVRVRVTRQSGLVRALERAAVERAETPQASTPEASVMSDEAGAPETKVTGTNTAESR
ncbi:MAG: exodeoxyribonuclease V subunit alpha [Polyangiaceae bacterium]